MGLPLPNYSPGLASLMRRAASARRILFGLDSLWDPTTASFLASSFCKNVGFVPRVTGAAVGFAPSGFALGLNAQGPLTLNLKSDVNNKMSAYQAISANAIDAINQQTRARGARLAFTGDPTSNVGAGQIYAALYPTTAQRTNSFKGGDPFNGVDTTCSLLLQQNTTSGVGTQGDIGAMAWIGKDDGSNNGAFNNAGQYNMNAAANTFRTLTANITGGVNDTNHNPCLAIGKAAGAAYTAAAKVDLLAGKIEAATGCTFGFFTVYGLTSYLYGQCPQLTCNAYHSWFGATDLIVVMPGANTTGGDYTDVAGAQYGNLKQGLDRELAAQAAIGSYPGILFLPTFDAAYWRINPNGGTGTVLVNKYADDASGLQTIQPREARYYEDVEKMCWDMATAYRAAGVQAEFINTYRLGGPAGSLVAVATSADWQHCNSVGADKLVSIINLMASESIASSTAYGTTSGNLNRLLR